MSRGSGEPQGQSVLEAAMAWRAEVADRALPPDRMRALRAWLCHPQNAAAYEKADVLWRDLGWSQALNEEALKVEPLVIPPVHAARRKTPPAGMTRRWLGAGFGAAAVLGGLAVLTPALTTGAGKTAPELHLATEVGEIRQVTLEDGSRLALGGRSVAVVRLTSGRREVELLTGDAWFDVEPDSARPFTVRADDLKATVLGTVFEVRRNPRGVQVAVAEGRVRVVPARGEAVILGRGEGVRALDGGALAAFQMAPGDAGRWRQQRFSYRNAPLSEMVEDLNRYYPPGVRLQGTRLGALRVSAAFRLDQLEAALGGLALSHDLSVTRNRQGGFILTPESVPAAG